jgi:hypothetical protein
MKKFTCLYYWLVDPVQNGFLDTSESQPAFEIPIKTNKGVYKFAVFVSDSRNPEYARLTLPDLEEEKIPNDLLPYIQAIREHFLSILRITYNPEATLFPRPFWTFLDDLSSYTMGFEIKRNSNFSFDIERARNLFISYFPYRDEIRLFIDGNDNRIPLQYRFLSLFKIIELQFIKQGHWQEERIKALLDKYQSSFKDIGVEKPYKHIRMLRDKCAHIKTGTRK